MLFYDQLKGKEMINMTTEVIRFTTRKVEFGLEGGIEWGTPIGCIQILDNGENIKVIIEDTFNYEEVYFNSVEETMTNLNKRISETLRG